MLARRSMIILGVALLTLPPALPAAADTPVHSGFGVQTVATDTGVRSDRRAMAGGVYDATAEKTFISWIGVGSDPYLAAFDHRRQTWSAPVRAGDSPFGDAHNYPAMVQADDGRLLVFHGSHNSIQKLTISQPHSIEGAWTDIPLPLAPRSSYPMPVKAGNGDIYLFFRDTPHLDDRTKFTDDRPIHYLLSTDNGQTWRHSRELTGAPFVIGSVGRPDNHNEIYLGEINVTPARLGVPERFHFVWTIAGGGPDRHLHDNFHRNLYYATFQPADKHFYDAAGTDLGPDIDGADMDQRAQVLATELVRAIPLTRDIGYTHLVGVMVGRFPVVTFHRQDGDTTVINAAVWTGRSWQTRAVHRDGTLLDMEQVSPVSFRVYTKPADGSAAVATFLLHLGTIWRPEEVIATPTTIQRGNVITGHRSPVRMILDGQTSTSNQNLADGDMFVLGSSRTG